MVAGFLCSLFFYVSGLNWFLQLGGKFSVFALFLFARADWFLQLGGRFSVFALFLFERAELVLSIGWQVLCVRSFSICAG